MKVRILIFSIIALSISCKLDKLDEVSKIKGVELDGTYGTALFNDEFSVMDILERFDSLNQIFINDEGYISYIVKQNSSSILGNDYINLPDQSMSNSFPISATAVSLYNAASPGNSVYDSMEFNWNFSNPPHEIDSILLKEGKLFIEINSNMTIQSHITFEMKNLNEPNGDYFNLPLNIPASGYVNNNTNLNGYFVDLTDNGTRFNKIKIKVKIKLSKNSASDKLNIGNGISYKVELTNQKFKRLFGFFGNDILTIPTKELKIDLFEASTGLGMVSIEAPKLTLYIHNTYGFSARINSISPFEAKRQDNSVIQITGAPVPFTIEAPDRIYEKKTSKLVLKAPDINIKQLIDGNIKEIRFGAKAESNPNGATKNFALDTSKITMTSEVEIPF